MRISLAALAVLLCAGLYSSVAVASEKSAETAETKGSSSASKATSATESINTVEKDPLSQGRALRFDQRIQLLVGELSPSMVSVQIANQASDISDLRRAVGSQMDLSHAQPILLRYISALVIDTGGYLLCAASMLGDDDSMFLTINGRNIPVRRIGVDFRSGLALLQANMPIGMNLIPARFSERAPGVGAVALFLAAGDGVVEPMITMSRATRLEGYLEFSGANGAGAAGGAFFDMDGRLLAVALGSLDESGSVNRIFATPVSRIAPIISRLKCCGDRAAGYLGVQVIGAEVRGLSRERLAEPAFATGYAPSVGVSKARANSAQAINASFATTEEVALTDPREELIKGALLTVVEVGSPAELAGLRTGDVVFSCDNTPIENAESFRDYIRGCRPDSLIEISSLRGLREQSHSIRIINAPGQTGFQVANKVSSRGKTSLESENESFKRIILDLQRRVELLEKRLANSSGTSRP